MPARRGFRKTLMRGKIELSSRRDELWLYPALAGGGTGVESSRAYDGSLGSVVFAPITQMAEAERSI